MIIIPIVVTALSALGALIFGTAGGSSPYPSPPLPGGKVPPVPVPPSNAQAWWAQAKETASIMAAPTENSDIVTDLPAGSGVLLPNVKDLRPATPGAPWGWVATGDKAGGVGFPYGWVSLSNLVLVREVYLVNLASTMGAAAHTSRAPAYSIRRAGYAATCIVRPPNLCPAYAHPDQGALHFPLIPYGHVVRVLEERGLWSHVRYEPPHGSAIMTWVPSGFFRAGTSVVSGAHSAVGQFSASDFDPMRLIAPLSEAEARQLLESFRVEYFEAQRLGRSDVAAYATYLSRLADAVEVRFGRSTTSIPSGPGTPTPPEPPPPPAPPAAQPMRAMCNVQPYCTLWSVDLSQPFGVWPGAKGLFAPASPAGQRVYRNAQVPTAGFMLYATLDDGTQGWMDPYQLTPA